MSKSKWELWVKRLALPAGTFPVHGPLSISLSIAQDLSFFRQLLFRRPRRRLPRGFVWFNPRKGIPDAGYCARDWLNFVHISIRKRTRTPVTSSHYCSAMKIRRLKQVKPCVEMVSLFLEFVTRPWPAIKLVFASP